MSTLEEQVELARNLANLESMFGCVPSREFRDLMQKQPKKIFLAIYESLYRLQDLET